MPAALAGSIGMPTVPLLHHKTCKIRQRREQGHLEVALAGEALQNRREPEIYAVASRR